MRLTVHGFRLFGPNAETGKPNAMSRKP